MAWLAVVVACSLIARVDDGWLASWLSLQPRKVMHGELWRLVSWPLIELRMASTIFAVIAIARRGDDLASHWGFARLFRYVGAVTLACGVAYVLGALVVGDATMWRCGGTAHSFALEIAWARAFPDGKLTYFRTVTLSGLGIIGMMCAFALLEVMIYGPIESLPEIAACALAVVWPQRSASVT